MEKQSTEVRGASSVQWENLEAWIRTQVQGFIQQILDEVSVILARQKSQRRIASRTNVTPSQSDIGYSWCDSVPLGQGGGFSAV